MINMLIMNEYTTIMNDVESDFLLDVQTLLGKGELNPEAKALLPVWIDSLMYKSLKFNEFGLRLPNVIVLLLTFFGFYYFGKKIFGLKNTVVTLLVLGSSFLPVNLAKFATGDVWLFGVQLMSFVVTCIGYHWNALEFRNTHILLGLCSSISCVFDLLILFTVI